MGGGGGVCGSNEITRRETGKSTRKVNQGKRVVDIVEFLFAQNNKLLFVCTS